MLWVDNNKLTGLIPSSICPVIQVLDSFDFSFNSFSCPLPNECEELLVEGETVCGLLFTTSDEVIVGASVGAVLVIATMALVTAFLLKKRNLRKLGHDVERVSLKPLLSAAEQHDVDFSSLDSEDTLREIEKCVDVDETDWPAVKVCFSNYLKCCDQES